MQRSPTVLAPRPQLEGSSAAAYLRLLEGVGARADAIGAERLIAAHWPFVGSNYRGLMIAGQALERWDSPESTAVWPIGAARTPDGRERVLRGTQAWATREREPIAEQLEPGAGGPWLSRYAWWNLYPIGWQDRHGTPTGDLHAAQTPYVADLFWAVADELEVKRLLLVSGKDWWWNVRELLGLQGLKPGSMPVIASGKVDDIAVVATYHPGAHIKGGTRIGFAAAAVDAMRSLDR
jgi:hypothetical protein